MKRFESILIYAVVAAVVLSLGVLRIGMAAAPLVRNFSSSQNTFVVDLPFDGVNANTAWNVVDSLIVVASDSANILLTISGTADMFNGGILYVGFGNDSANRVDSATSATTGATNSNLDTLKIQAPRQVGGAAMKTPFSFTFPISNDGAVTDTFYFNMSSGHGGTIVLNDVVVTASVADQ